MTRTILLYLCFLHHITVFGQIHVGVSSATEHWVTSQSKLNEPIPISIGGVPSDEFNRFLNAFTPPNNLSIESFSGLHLKAGAAIDVLKSEKFDLNIGIALSRRSRAVCLSSEVNFMNLSTSRIEVLVNQVWYTPEFTLDAVHHFKRFGIYVQANFGSVVAMRIYEVSNSDLGQSGGVSQPSSFAGWRRLDANHHEQKNFATLSTGVSHELMTDLSIRCGYFRIINDFFGPLSRPRVNSLGALEFGVVKRCNFKND